MTLAFREIDLVVTWVNGDDPEWQARKARYQPEWSLGPTDDVAGRYRDQGELRYLLRSIETFDIPFRNIVVVLDGNPPTWLNTDHPKIRVVQHPEFIEGDLLPTFSSKAIEASLHRIPGLPEHFLSVNDDILFGRSLDVSDLFSVDDRPLVYMDDRRIVRETPSIEAFADDNANRVARPWCESRMRGYSPARMNAHTPKLVSRTMMRRLEAEHPIMFRETRSQRFRDHLSHSILATTYGHWMVGHGNAVIAPADDSLCYIKNASPNADRLYNHAMAGAFYAICVQDTTDNAGADHPAFSRQHSFYERFLPDASSFEKTALKR